jgi:predicted HD phosphohydrolase
MALSIQDITRLFHTHGASQYGAEAVTQQQHALQCAHLAEQAGASVELVAVAFKLLSYAADAQALRRWDDGAKNPAAITPGWDHYQPTLDKASRLALALPADIVSL